jgi:Exostosin family
MRNSFLLQVAMILSGVVCVVVNHHMAQRASVKQETAQGPVRRQPQNDRQIVPKIDDGLRSFNLKVPFYIYENSELNWENATLDGVPYLPAGLDDKAFNAKHDDDFFMLRAAMRHPLRTHDPIKAQLFYVPTILNAVLDRGSGYQLDRGEFCVNGQCFKKGRMRRHLLVKMVDDALGQSPYFRKSDGKDHVIALSHFSSRGLSKEFTNVHKCNSIIFEREITAGAKQFPDRIRIPGMYIGNPCRPVPKTHDFAMIASLRDDEDIPDYRKELFRARGYVCKWLQQETIASIHTCGGGSQCPALGAARYGFHVRGDTWGSNRLMDTIMSRTIPIFTNEIQYDILPPFYPWRRVSYIVDVSNRDTFKDAIHRIMERPESDYAEKLKIIDQNMHLLNHTQPYMFDRFMAEFAKELKLQ